MVAIKDLPPNISALDWDDWTHISVKVSLIWWLAPLFLCYSLVHTWRKLCSFHGIPQSIPWAGPGTGFLARGRANLKSVLSMRENIKDGYEKYSKNDKPFVLPNLIFGPEVMLPQSQIKWLLEQPDHVLSQAEVNKEYLSGDRTMLHKNVIRDTIHKPIIQTEISKGLDSLAPGIVDEIRNSLGQHWGNDTQAWREIHALHTVEQMIPHVANRILVGLPLCRNDEYIKSASTFGKNVVLITSFDHLLPPLLRPILMPLATAYDMFLYRQITKFIFPVIKERLPAFQLGRDYKNPDYSEHNDFVQWALHYAFSHDDPLERTPEMITKRLTVLAFGSTHSIITAVTSVLFDIASLPDSKAVQQTLREEVLQVTSKYPGKEWSRASLLQMVRLDSALRESLRLWSFSIRGITKKVLAPQGVILPSGEHIPCGINIGVTSYAPHRDESVYHDALLYKPFRWAGLSDASNVDDAAARAGEFANKPTPMVSTSDYYMAFSHGRHACPGRYLASHELKCILAQILLNYDIDPIPKRPENVYFNNVVGPPMGSNLRVRRRPEGSNEKY